MKFQYSSNHHVMELVQCFSQQTLFILTVNTHHSGNVHTHKHDVGVFLQTSVFGGIIIPFTTLRQQESHVRLPSHHPSIF